jgi:hypothetical protein
MQKRYLRLPLLVLLCGSGLALAATRVVHAPAGRTTPSVPGDVPSDRYLDLGAAQPLVSSAGYEAPRHVWQSEASRSVVPDETRYLDVARWRP